MVGHANDTISTNEDTAVITDVLANDTFGPNARGPSVTQGSHGTVAINPDGTVTYTPNEDYHGPIPTPTPSPPPRATPKPPP